MIEKLKAAEMEIKKLMGETQSLKKQAASDQEVCLKIISYNWLCLHVCFSVFWVVSFDQLLPLVFRGMDEET